MLQKHLSTSVLHPLNDSGRSLFSESLVPGALLAVVVATGHFGFWIWLFNRVNSTGLPRKTIKRSEKLIVLVCGVIPVVLVWHAVRSLNAVDLGGDGSLLNQMESLLAFVYCVSVGLFAFVMAPFWLAARPQFAIAKDRYAVLEAEDLNQLQHPIGNAEQYISGARFRRMAKLPGNQIVSIQRNRKQLYLEDLPEDMVGLRIAHLSDVHLTGQLSTSFYRLAMDWVCEQTPDLIVLSGDIVDYETELKQLQPVFAGLKARLGMHFILGNHDKRLPVPTAVCDGLVSMGWTDLGKAESLVRNGATRIRLLGNELPWFRRGTTPSVAPIASTSNSSLCQESNAAEPNAAEWILGVSHSPDQFKWGISHRCNLLLCGHTHGGQIRLPVLGPIVAPSKYGSRFASGVFFRNPTLMHVSRGMSGVHPFRWGCIPEVTVLELAGFKTKV